MVRPCLVGGCVFFSNPLSLLLSILVSCVRVRVFEANVVLVCLWTEKGMKEGREGGEAGGHLKHEEGT